MLRVVTSAPPRAVLFDADGVLQAMGPVVEHLVDRYGWRSERATNFLHDYWRRESECGCLSGSSEFEKVLAVLLEDWDVVDEPARFYESFLSVAIQPNPERGRARFMSERLGYGQLFDLKTDPAYFARVLSDLRLPAGEVLFLDDHQPNVETARACGLRAEVIGAEADVRRSLQAHGLVRPAATR
jgi:putative hydrolase of the HAD superfamily